MPVRHLQLMLGGLFALAVFTGWNLYKAMDGEGNAALAATDAAAGPGYDVRGLKHEISRDQDVLFRMSGPEIRAVLNAPELIRRDGPVTVWQYRSETCVLDLYFSATAPESEAAPVKHYEVRPRSGRDADRSGAASCVRQLVRTSANASFFNFGAIYKSGS